MPDGTEQRERLPAALEEGYVLVDELRFDQLAAMSAGLADRLRFFDLGQREAGTWAEMFASDEAMVLARIAGLDRHALQSAFLREADAAPLPCLARDVVRLANWLDLWFKSLAANPGPVSQSLRERIGQLVEQHLAGELDWVHRSFGDQRWEGRAVGYSRSRMDPIWSARSNHEAPASARSDRERLRGAYFALLSAIARVQGLARELLPRALATPTHEPGVGLLMAFLQLYGTVQQQVNRFTDKHVDFYYRDCLGLRPQAACADSVHLACQRDARATQDLALPAGTAFAAGKDAAGRPVEFASDEALRVTDARVADLRTLRLERDPLISPERELGYVTRAKATRIPVAVNGEMHWPLFGGSAAASVPTGAEDARLGVALASPVLLLKEGEREIDLTVRFAQDTPADGALVDAVLGAPSADDFFRALGQLFRRWLFADRDFLSDAQLQALRATAQGLLGDKLPASPGAGDPLCLLCGDQRPVRDLIFDQLLNGVFDVALTTAAGWADAGQVQVRRASPDPGTAGGMRMVIRLRPEDAAITGCDPALHGSEWPTRHPLLRLQLGTRGRLYGYSLFEGLGLAEARVCVKVSGVRDLVLHNNLGRLDAGKPFNPFGPLPTVSSYMVFGAPELARKNVSALSLCIEWSGLPADIGGFDTWYRAYGPDYRNGSFTAAPGILRDGQWQACGNEGARQPLFAPLDASGRLAAVQVITFDPGAVRKHCRAGTEEIVFDLAARNGFFRLQLAGPPGAFGHAAYPVLLAETVTANARRRRRPLPLPNAPYTPLIERFTLAYEARSSVRLARNGDAGAAPDCERLLHLHPFGIAEVDRAAAAAAPDLLPRIEHDGNLYIGIAAGELQGPLSLLFHLREEAAAEPLGTKPQANVRFAVRASGRWQVLPPSRVLSDGTGGLLGSGIVSLDLPTDTDRDHTVVPEGLYWLRVSADQGFDGVAGLHGVQAQALRATRRANGAAALLPAGTIAQPVSTVAGLAGVTQVGPSFGLREAEDTRRFRARAGERLQHKGRASLAWDAERLVLEHFPEVAKVKAFSAQEFGARAGQVRVVVVPAVRRNHPEDSTLAPRLDAATLKRVQGFLAQRASPFAGIEVRNAAYERIQLRCLVQLHRGTQPGVALRRINDAAVAYLSPWHDVGYAPRFDWTARCEDLEAHLRSLDEVSAVAGLSLLQVASSDEAVYTLGDTARQEPAAHAGAVPGQLRARVPWSIALPMRTHMIGLADELADAQPQPTGIARLAVGSTFIIGRGAP